MNNSLYSSSKGLIHLNRIAVMLNNDSTVLRHARKLFQILNVRSTRTRLKMQIQRTFRNVTRLTQMTNVGPLPRMAPHMYPQRGPLIEAFPAVLARVRFFPAMNPFVHDKIIPLSEAFRAVRTSVRLYTGMNPIVHFQLIFRRKAFPANIAKMAFLVGPRPQMPRHVVLLHRGHLGKDPLANATLVRHHFAFDAHPMVPDLMRQQITRERKTFAANNATKRFDP